MELDNRSLYNVDWVRRQQTAFVLNFRVTVLYVKLGVKFILAVIVNETRL